jgi:hypothetical protein
MLWTGLVARIGTIENYIFSLGDVWDRYRLGGLYVDGTGEG